MSADVDASWTERLKTMHEVVQLHARVTHAATKYIQHLQQRTNVLVCEAEMSLILLDGSMKPDLEPLLEHCRRTCEDIKREAVQLQAFKTRLEKRGRFVDDLKRRIEALFPQTVEREVEAGIIPPTYYP